MNNEEFNQLLSSISLGFWLTDLLTVAILLILYNSSNKLNSTLIAMAVILLFDGVKSQYIGYLTEISLDTNTKRYWWYVGLAFINVIETLFIWFVHQHRKIKISAIVRILILALYVKSVIHIFRLIERQLFDSDTYMYLYKGSLVGVNGCTTIAVCIVSLVTLYCVIKNKKIEGKLWVL